MDYLFKGLPLALEECCFLQWDDTITFIILKKNFKIKVDKDSLSWRKNLYTIKKSN